MSSIQYRTLGQRPVVAPQAFDNAVSWLSRLPWTIAGTLVTWQRRANERHHLAALDARLLRDMGITKTEAAREAALPFWRLT